MVVCHLPYGPTAYFGIFNAVLRHDIGAKRAVGTISEAPPRLILDRLTSPLGRRIGTILKHLFPAPKVRARVCARVLALFVCARVPLTAASSERFSSAAAAALCRGNDCAAT